MKKTFQVLALAAATLLFSCEGKQGEIGPAGPQGTAGVAGVAGAKGEEGDPAGAVQVTFGPVVTDANGDYAFSSEFPTNTPVSQLEKGIVNCYVKNNSFWFPVPGKVPFPEANDLVDIVFGYKFVGNKFTIGLSPASLSKKLSYQDVRIVFVPAVNARLNANLDWSNYNAVKEALNLAD